MRKLVERINKIREEINNALPFPLEEGDSLILEDCKFLVDGETLILFDEDDEEYHYTISSYGAKGEEFWLHETEEEVIVSAYDDDRGWSTADVYVLDRSKQIFE